MDSADSVDSVLWSLGQTIKHTERKLQNVKQLFLAFGLHFVFGPTHLHSDTEKGRGL